MTDEKLREIWALCFENDEADDVNDIHDLTAHCRALIAEVRRLQERVRQLDPYGRGVVSASEDF